MSNANAGTPQVGNPNTPVPAGTMMPTALFSAFVAFLAAALFVPASHESSAWYAAIMLAISGILELTLVRWRRRPPMYLALIPPALELAKGAAILAYCQNWNDACAIVALILGILAIVYTGLLAWDAVKLADDGQDKDPGLSSGVFTIWVMFVIFLHVMYLCALSVAIHNKATGERALLQTRLLRDFREGLPETPGGRPVCSTIRFDPGCPAALDCIDNSQLAKLIGDSEIQKAADSTDKDAAEAIQDKMTEQNDKVRYSDQAVKTAVGTIRTVIQLKGTIADQCAPLQDRKPVCRVTLLGHATDDLNSEADPKANDRLAWRRAVSVFDLLDKTLARNDLEWRFSAASNRDYVMNAETSARQDGTNHKLYTEIRLEKLAPSLTLMDYLYFMTYTVSTTGYGDLMPGDAFVQLVVSIANLYEIFFVVICLNVILESSVKNRN